MNISELHKNIGQTIVDSIEVNDWKEAKLYIEYIGAVSFKLEYLKEEQISSKINNPFSLSRTVKKIHEITTDKGNNKWNKSVFTLNSDNSFDMEFIWDQELQDEVESYLDK